MMPQFLTSSGLQVVVVGTAVLGALCGLMGCFAVVRRQSLQGDAISHAALPGLALAFLFGAREVPWLLAGAALTGTIMILCVGTIARQTRLPYEGVLGGLLAVFFGVGLALLTAIKKQIPDAATHGLDRYLFGQAATLSPTDVHGFLVLFSIASLLVILFWKPLKLMSFNPEYAATLGWPVRSFDAAFLVLLAATVVVGLQAVGVVMMSALLVAPAVAARQLVNRLGPMCLVAMILGTVSAVSGTLLGDALSKPGRSVPTGPTIVVCATLIVGVAIVMRKLRLRLIPRTES